MTIVQCPRCRDEVTVPAKASPKALVRCPLCLEEYLLIEALTQLPPALLVIDGSVTEDEPALVGAGAAAAGEDEYRMSGGAYGGMLDSSAPAGAKVAPSRPQVKAAPRPKKKEKSAIAEGVKIILGGIVGLGMGLLVLWWVFGKDPLELGPKVSPYAPWIVPSKFRTLASSGAETVANPGANSTVPANGTAPANTNNNNNATGAMAAVPQPGNNGNGRPRNGGNRPRPENPSGLEITSDPLASGEPLALDNLPFEATLPTTPTPVRPAAGETPLVNPEPERIGLDPVALNPTKPEPEPVPPPSTEPSAAEFQAAVLAASDALTKVNEVPAAAPREERLQKFTVLHQAGGELGRIVTQLDLADASVSAAADTLKTFLGSLAAVKGKLSAIRVLGAKQFPDSKHGEGILLAGTVGDIQPRGSTFELTLNAGMGLEALPVVSATNPADFCQAGDEVVLVGRIVDEPQKHLPQYPGDATRVVLLGYLVPAPKSP